MDESREEDATLVASAVAGDRDAFGALVRRHQSAALATARHLLRDVESAREAAQEAFLRAWTGLASYSGRGSFRAWLLSILRNLCLDTVRRERWRVGGKVGCPGAQRAVPPRGEAVLRHREQRRALEEVLEDLTPRQRHALVLSAAEDCSAAEVAAALGCAVSTARVTIFQARRKAARLLERHVEGLGMEKEKARETLLGL